MSRGAGSRQSARGSIDWRTVYEQHDRAVMAYRPKGVGR